MRSRFATKIGLAGARPPLAPWLFSIIILTGVLTGCAISPGNVEDGNPPIVTGPTDSAMYDEVLTHVKRGTKKIVIRSYGGEESTAIEIGKLLNRHEIEIVVDSYCTSSCAQYLVAASPKTFIEKGALLSFHMNSYGLITGGYVHRDLEKFALLKRNADAANQLYRTSGRDPAFMRLATDASKLQCIVHRNGKPRGAFARYEVWIPTREILSTYGFNISGYLPRDREEALAVAYSYLKPSTNISFGPVYSNIGKRPLQQCAK